MRSKMATICLAVLSGVLACGVFQATAQPSTPAAQPTARMSPIPLPDSPLFDYTQQDWDRLRKKCKYLDDKFAANVPWTRQDESAAFECRAVREAFARYGSVRYGPPPTPTPSTLKLTPTFIPPPLHLSDTDVAFDPISQGNHYLLTSFDAVDSAHQSAQSLWFVGKIETLGTTQPIWNTQYLDSATASYAYPTIAMDQDLEVAYTYTTFDPNSYITSYWSTADGFVASNGWWPTVMGSGTLSSSVRLVFPELRGRQSLRIVQLHLLAAPRPR